MLAKFIKHIVKIPRLPPSLEILSVLVSVTLSCGIAIGTGYQLLLAHTHPFSAFLVSVILFYLFSQIYLLIISFGFRLFINHQDEF